MIKPPETFDMTGDWSNASIPVVMIPGDVSLFNSPLKAAGERQPSLPVTLFQTAPNVPYPAWWMIVAEEGLARVQFNDSTFSTSMKRRFDVRVHLRSAKLVRSMSISKRWAMSQSRQWLCLGGAVRCSRGRLL